MSDAVCPSSSQPGQLPAILLWKPEPAASQAGWACAVDALVSHAAPGHGLLLPPELREAVLSKLAAEDLLSLSATCQSACARYAALRQLVRTLFDIAPLANYKLRPSLLCRSGFHLSPLRAYSREWREAEGHRAVLTAFAQLGRTYPVIPRWAYFEIFRVIGCLADGPSHAQLIQAVIAHARRVSPQWAAEILAQYACRATGEDYCLSAVEITRALLDQARTLYLEAPRCRHAAALALAFVCQRIVQPDHVKLQRLSILVGTEQGLRNWPDPAALWRELILLVKQDGPRLAMPVAAGMVLTAQALDRMTGSPGFCEAMRRMLPVWPSPQAIDEARLDTRMAALANEDERRRRHVQRRATATGGPSVAPAGFHFPPAAGRDQRT